MATDEPVDAVVVDAPSVDEPDASRAPTKPISPIVTKLEIELGPDADAQALAAFFETLAKLISSRRRFVISVEIAPEPNA